MDDAQFHSVVYETTTALLEKYIFYQFVYFCVFRKTRPEKDPRDLHFWCGPGHVSMKPKRETGELNLNYEGVGQREELSENWTSKLRHLVLTLT